MFSGSKNNFKKIGIKLRTFSNVNVLHKGLLLQDWVFRLGSYTFQLQKRIVDTAIIGGNTVCSET